MTAVAGRSPLRRAGPVAACTAILAAGLAACGIDQAELAVCRRLIAAFEEDPTRVTIERIAAHPTHDNGIILDYRLTGEPPEAALADAGATDGRPTHWISCRFEGGGLPWFAGDPRLVEVASDRSGRLSDIDLQMLKIWLRVRPGRPGEDRPISRKR